MLNPEHRALSRRDTIVSYVVNWRGPDGQAGWHPVGDLPEAAAHVEHLRNVEGVSETKIFKLEEVAFEFRQYFRVELAADEAPAPAPTFSVPAAVEAPAPEPEPEPVAEAAWAEPAEEPAPVAVPSFETGEPVLAEVGADDGGSNGARRGLFGR
jgi:hypothetical protein